VTRRRACEFRFSDLLAHANANASKLGGEGEGTHRCAGVDGVDENGGGAEKREREREREREVGARIETQFDPLLSPSPSSRAFHRYRYGAPAEVGSPAGVHLT